MVRELSRIGNHLVYRSTDNTKFIDGDLQVYTYI
jgi:hypothetical protein